ncbi:MAG: M56 family metallopeptidase [Cytophagaceae bacterium]|nr:M56 family metallopeptidase [Gemmatimonadaceae bacterium]
MDAFGFVRDGLVPALALALSHSLWQGALLAVAAALALQAMARASAAWRHRVAMAFLVAMVLAPAFQFLRFWQSDAQFDDGPLPAMGDLFLLGFSPVAVAVVITWLSGMSVMLVRHVGGLRALAAMERGPHQMLPPAWRQRVDELRASLGITRPVAVLLSDDVLTPCAARLLRPVIWLPLPLPTRAPREQLEALLAHELAHIARHDWLWNGGQRVIESLLFFHPAVWWLGRRIRQEREHACDDLAVAACGDAVALAEALAALERERHSPPALVLAAHEGSLLQRITRLLSGTASRGRWGAPAVLGVAAVTGVFLVALIGVGGGRLPDLRIESSTNGALGPGDYREIIANGHDKLRFYRASVDAQGRLTEVYQQDRRAHPIDAEVRTWLAEVTRPTVP